VGSGYDRLAGARLARTLRIARGVGLSAAARVAHTGIEVAAMTEEEATAFEAGYRFAIEESILAHDVLLVVAASGNYFERQCEAFALADWHDEQVLASMHRVRHLRLNGHEQALALWRLEREWAQS
jgi:hypothetical protein